MHVDDITTALAACDMGSIQQAFHALADYPKQEEVTGLRAGTAMTCLEVTAAKALEAIPASCRVMHAMCSDSLRRATRGGRAPLSEA